MMDKSCYENDKQEELDGLEPIEIRKNIAGFEDKGGLDPYKQLETLKELVMDISGRLHLNNMNLRMINDIFWSIINLFPSYTVSDSIFEENLLRVSHFYVEKDEILASTLWMWANMCENGASDSYLINNVLNSSLISRVLNLERHSSQAAHESLIRLFAGISLAQQKFKRPRKEIEALYSLLNQDFFEIIKHYRDCQPMIQNAIIYLNWCVVQRFPKYETTNSILEIAGTLKTQSQRSWMLHLLENLISHYDPNMAGFVALILAFFRDCLLSDEKEYAQQVAICLGNLLHANNQGINDLTFLFDDNFFIGFLTRCVCQQSTYLLTEALFVLNSAKDTQITRALIHPMREIVYSLCYHPDLLVKSYAKHFMKKSL